MIGNNSPENHCKDLVAVSNGSFELLANYNGIPPDQLLQLLGRAADIISTCRISPPPSCTLKIAPGSGQRRQCVGLRRAGRFQYSRR